VTSYVFRNGRLDAERLRHMRDAVGRERLVLDLSCRKRDDVYWVVTDRWQRFSELSIMPETLARLADSCNEFLVHGVDVEGLRLGPAPASGSTFVLLAIVLQSPPGSGGQALT